MKKEEVKQGGFSDEVWQNKYLQEYISNNIVSGYVGTSGRTDFADRHVERILESVGLSKGEIAIWLTSTSGRHLCDAIYGEKKAHVIVNHILSFAIRAKEELENW